jgi:hypothetical protein
LPSCGTHRHVHGLGSLAKKVSTISIGTNWWQTILHNAHQKKKITFENYTRNLLYYENLSAYKVLQADQRIFLRPYSLKLSRSNVNERENCEHPQWPHGAKNLEKMRVQ